MYAVQSVAVNVIVLFEWSILCTVLLVAVALHAGIRSSSHTRYFWKYSYVSSMFIVAVQDPASAVSVDPSHISMSAPSGI